MLLKELEKQSESQAISAQQNETLDTVPTFKSNTNTKSKTNVNVESNIKEKDSKAFKINDTIIITDKNETLSFGIVIIVYHILKSKCEEYVELAIQVGKSIREAEPNVPLTLISSHIDFPEVTKVFTSAIIIPSNMIFEGRQWRTRIQAMALSPYYNTLSVDADTYACSPFVDDFKKAIKERQVDFAVNGHGNL